MIAAFLLGWWGTFLLAFPIYQYASRRLLDRPSARSSHTTPTPRGGGGSIVLTVLLFLPPAYGAGLLSGALTTALLGGVLLALMGWLDDHRSLPIPLRLGVQVAAAAWSLFWLSQEASFSAWLTPVLFGLLLWFTNLYNFMDGIDGLVSSQGFFWSLVLALAAGWRALPEGILLALLSGSFLSFLLWNWPRAEIFLGDVGSQFLGFTLGLLQIALFLKEPPLGVSAAVMTAPFWIDATWTLISRFIRGERWYLPHRSHAYQKLACRLGHLRVTTLYLLFSLIWLLPSALWALKGGGSAMMGMAVATAPILLLMVHIRAGEP